jgi:hypothetical protein
MAQARVLSGTAKGAGNSSADPKKPTYALAVGRGTGSNRLDVLVKALESVQLSDQHDLHEALEAFRMLGHRLAVEAMMMSHELEEGVKAEARNRSMVGVVGWSARSKIRRTVKAFRNMADAFAAAGAGAVATWKAFERDFEEDLSPTKTKPRGRKGFTINPG